ncbi:MAG: hypothetical protein JWN60_829 [Acidobacteria bacterium]|jgi:hypothetical protein|nr:hypothetical protein [Acidobacteriota bacterium]
MFYRNLKTQKSFILFCLTFLAFCAAGARAQSTSQIYPTPVATNEISGTIKARDIGDARLTNYFYAFNANQGDLFINVVTSNFNGDIDVFNADGLKHLSKIVVYADSSFNETGRVIYFRKPEKLILRIEGRTPNDDAGTFKIKFAGSFVAAADAKTEEPALPEIASSNQTDVRVNSVGTIVEVKPKATPAPVETAAKTNISKETVKEISVETGKEKTVIAETDTADNNDRKIEVKESGQKLEVVVTENAQTQAGKTSQTAPETTQETTAATVAEPETRPVDKISINETVITKTESDATEAPAPKETTATKKAAARTGARTKTKTAKTPKPIEPNPLENIRLIVLFKDGAKIERPMSEVLKVGVDKGVLTIISKNGAIGRYSILDVAKMTIE